MIPLINTSIVDISNQSLVVRNNGKAVVLCDSNTPEPIYVGCYVKCEPFSSGTCRVAKIADTSYANIKELILFRVDMERELNDCNTFQALCRILEPGDGLEFKYDKDRRKITVNVHQQLPDSEEKK